MVGVGLGGMCIHFCAQLNYSVEVVLCFVFIEVVTFNEDAKCCYPNSSSAKNMLMSSFPTLAPEAFPVTSPLVTLLTS